MRAFSGVRGRVTFTVFAVSAILYSVLGTIGLVTLADNGREAIKERIEEVLDQLEGNLRNGGGALTISTNDGIDAELVIDGEPPAAVDGMLQVVREIAIGGQTALLVGRSSQARLSDSLQSLHRSLWVAIPLASVLSAAMAGLATRRSLRPVGAITDLADSIGGTMSGARVPVPDTDDEIAHLATTLNAMLDRLDAGRVAQRQFTSDAAHELRTPLMALQGELELVSNGAQQFDAPTLDRMVALSKRLGERIDDLVLLSTLDEGRPLSPEHLDLRAMVSAELAELAPGAQCAGDATPIVADAGLIARAIRNLIVNATRHRRDTIALTIESAPGRVSLHIDDDGPGIPDQLRADVFGRFTRLDESRGTRSGGSGLGLAIVASVAAAHGGGVSATDSPLGGARFTLWLPSDPEAFDAPSV